MEKLRFIAALWIAKISVIALKVTRHNGTNFPGVVAIKICPQFMKHIGKPKKVVAVTGTNGKTTVTNMILDALTIDGKSIADNKAGSNINSGIATSLIQNASLTGRCKKEWGVFEIDERSALRIYPFMVPDYMVITNLSRDSIMRNGHPEYISEILTRYMPKTTKLILNADDFFCANVAPENDRAYYGIERMDTDLEKCENLIQDFQICPNCHHRLEYEYLRYGHIGKAYCPACGLKAPEYDYAGCETDKVNMTINIKDSSGEETYRLLNDSVYNIYNVVCVVALLLEMGYSRERVKEFMSSINIIGSRYDFEEYADKTLYMMLAKDRNAFAVSRVFEYLSIQPGEKEIVLMNNNYSDAATWSENTCWLYDCDFELLKDDSIKNIVVCGPRAKDYRLRLLLAGIEKSRISWCEKEMDTPQELELFEGDNIYVLYGTDSLDLKDRVIGKMRTVLKNCEGGEKL
ncbi:MAG: DUF1727 domain-containing protein [Clostridiales bacterium]|nr:DUF1727 domain-containing protein [Clostridiales bacterium]